MDQRTRHQSSAPRQAGGAAYGIEFLWSDVRIICCSLLLLNTTNILDRWLNRMNTKNNLHESTAMTCKSVIISQSLKRYLRAKYKVHLSKRFNKYSSLFKCQPERYLSLSISRKVLVICNSQRHLCGTKRWRKDVFPLQQISRGGDVERS